MTGRLVKIAGPTVSVRGLSDAALNEVVFVGAERLLGEVIRIEAEVATVQVYEDTAGLALGEPAEACGEPLSVELGPGLLGRIFDGVQRPLAELAVRDGDFAGSTASSSSSCRRSGPRRRASGPPSTSATARTRSA